MVLGSARAMGRVLAWGGESRERLWAVLDLRVWRCWGVSRGIGGLTGAPEAPG